MQVHQDISSSRALTSFNVFADVSDNDSASMWTSIVLSSNSTTYKVQEDGSKRKHLENCSDCEAGKYCSKKTI